MIAHFRKQDRSLALPERFKPNLSYDFVKLRRRWTSRCAGSVDRQRCASTAVLRVQDRYASGTSREREGAREDLSNGSSTRSSSLTLTTLLVSLDTSRTSSASTRSTTAATCPGSSGRTVGRRRFRREMLMLPLGSRRQASRGALSRSALDDNRDWLRGTLSASSHGIRERRVRWSCSAREGEEREARNRAQRDISARRPGRK